MYYLGDAVATTSSASGVAPTETMEQRDARRTRNVMLVAGAVVVGLFIFGYITDPPNKDHLVR